MNRMHNLISLTRWMRHNASITILNAIVFWSWPSNRNTSCDAVCNTDWPTESKEIPHYLSLTVFWPKGMQWHQIHWLDVAWQTTDLKGCLKYKPCNTSSFDANLLWPIKFNWFEAEKSTLAQVQLLLGCLGMGRTWAKFSTLPAKKKKTQKIWNRNRNANFCLQLSGSH